MTQPLPASRPSDGAGVEKNPPHHWGGSPGVTRKPPHPHLVRTMNFRFTAFLFVGVVALVVALLVANLTDPPPRPGAGLLEPLAAAGVKPAEIDTVEIVRPAETLVFGKTDGRWELRQPYPAKVDGAVLDALVRGLFAAKPTRFDGLTGNLAVHGLDKPVNVTLKAGDNAATVSVGATTLSGVNSTVTFVLAADRPTVPVAVPSQDLRPLFREGMADKIGPALDLTKRGIDFRLVQLLSMNPAAQGADVAAVRLSRDNATLALTHEADGRWRFTAPANYGEADLLGDPTPNPERVTGVQPLLNALGTFRPARRDDYIENVPPAEWSKYGVAATDPGVLRVEVTPKGKPPEVLFIGKPVEANGVPVVPAKVYCRLEGDPAVVPVQTDRATILAKTVADPSLMRNLDLIPVARKPRIDAVDVTAGGMDFRLRRVGTGPAQKWVVYGGSSDPTEARTAAVTDLIDAACAPRPADDVLLTAAPAAFDPKDITAKVTLHFDAVATAPPAGDALPPEPKLAAAKESAEPVTLTFVQRTPTAVTVRRVIGSGPPTDFILPVAPKPGQKAALAALAARPHLAYLNPSVGSFAIENAIGVSLKRGADTVYDLKLIDPTKLTGSEKDWFPAGKWANNGKPVPPTAVRQILMVLAGLDRSRPVAEAPPDPELTAFGLKPPRLTATVTLKTSPDKPKVYEFGNEIPNAGAYYFRVDGKLMVLAADKPSVDLVEKADLRDTVPHRVERAKITRVDLTWRNANGQPETLLLGQDSKTKWKPDEPKDFKLDADKAEALVKVLEAPPPAVAVPGPVKPEYKLTGEVLHVLVHRGLPGPVVFDLGAEDESRQFIYATSSEMPGVLKLPADPFRPYLSGRKSLSQ